MKLKEFMESHGEEARKGNAIICATFMDDWHGKPHKMPCNIYTDWARIFAECDITEERRSEAESQDVTFDGSTLNRRSITAYHIEIDGDQANLALGHEPPKTGRRAAKRNGRKRARFTL